MMSIIVILFSLVFALSLLFIIRLLRVQAKELKYLRNKLNAQHHDQEERLREHEKQMVFLQEKMALENRQTIDQEKAELQRRFQDLISTVEQMNQAVSNDLLNTEDKLRTKLNDFEDWKVYLETRHQDQEELYRQYQLFIENQLHKLAAQSKPLTEQLDAVTEKLCQIRELRGELMALDEPLELDHWQKYYQNVLPENEPMELEKVEAVVEEQLLG